jgi:hypothetical protein
MDAGGVATFGHFRSAERHQGITDWPADRRAMWLRPQNEGSRHVKTEDETQDNDQTRTQSQSYAAEQFATQQGERWRRFLERVGTHSNDFAVRLARARFVYLHRRETATHWLPL